MNLITRRPPQRIRSATLVALAPLSAELAIFVFRVVSVQLDLFLHLRLAVSLVSPRRPFSLGGGEKIKFRQRSNAQNLATSHKYHRREKNA